MKKKLALFIIVFSAFYTVTLYTACKTPPPPPPKALTPAPQPAVDQAPQPVVDPAPQPVVDPTSQPAVDSTEPLISDTAGQPASDPAEPQPDMSPPEINVQLTPQPYSPITPDGEEQLLTAKINVKSASPISAWQVEIREPESNGLVLSLGQKGEVPETLFWNGRNPDGELVESATVYNFSLCVTNIYNISAIYQGSITIDVLVQREEKNLLRIIVPSIVFAPYTGQLSKGLDPATAANNERILKRIAEVLTYFGTYNIKVEGHANPTYPPNSRQRADEEKGTRRIMGLQPLSEQRAKAVVEYLVKLGIDRSRLTSVGMGGTRVRVEFNDKANWWKNRRVEFILEKPEP